ncbi:hypothetical protein Tsubulata_024697 [Turnera subulata]|uniref:Ripening-related protein 1 n=1 Tax=Turnera subulata TaxID=218843 RepID=A0A9Q0JBN9_9ROSI|nr:hypothetical protein Tsubulata_024697 [Turnera subulata]
MKSFGLKASICILASILFVAVLALSTEAQQCRPSGRIMGKKPPPGECNQENGSDCCKQGKYYTTYTCSPAVTGNTRAFLTINSFQKGGDGGGPSECDNQYHDDDTPVVALSTGWFNNKNRCHHNITIKGNGRSVVAMVVDECDSTMGCDKDHDYQPPCDNNIVDASKAVWKALGVSSDSDDWGPKTGGSRTRTVDEAQYLEARFTLSAGSSTGNPTVTNDNILKPKGIKAKLGALPAAKLPGNGEMASIPGRRLPSTPPPGPVVADSQCRIQAKPKKAPPSEQGGAAKQEKSSYRGAGVSSTVGGEMTKPLAPEDTETKSTSCLCSCGKRPQSPLLQTFEKSSARRRSEATSLTFSKAHRRCREGKLWGGKRPSPMPSICRRLRRRSREASHGLHMRCLYSKRGLIRGGTRHWTRGRTSSMRTSTEGPWKALHEEAKIIPKDPEALQGEDLGKALHVEAKITPEDVKDLQGEDLGKRFMWRRK